MSRADTWMPLYIADYLKDTTELTREEHGAYLLLLMTCWTKGGRLPNRPKALAAIAKATLAEWEELAPAILPFFQVDGDELVHGRVVREREKSARLSEARQASGRLGGRPKKETKKEEGSDEKPLGSSNKNQTRSQTKTPSPSPYSDPDGSGDAEPRRDDKPPDPNVEAWQRGVGVLVERGRLKEAEARKFLGKLFRDHKLEGRDLLPSIVNCALNGTLEPQAYLTRAASAVAGRKGATAATPSPEERVAAWADEEWRYALEHYRKTGTWLEAWGPKPGEPGCRVPASLLITEAVGMTA